MTETDELRGILRDLKEDDFRGPENGDLDKLLPTMLDNVGYPEYELREQLIYKAFYTWIYSRPQLSDEAIRRILDTAVDESHLFYEIGSTEGVSVHTRTFSVLLIALVVAHHRDQNVLDRDTVFSTHATLVRYLNEERDLRGYLAGTGWAHSVAHAADAIDEIALCREMGRTELLQILDVLRLKVCVDSYVYIDEEDERIATAVMSVISRDLISQREIQDWIKGFQNFKNANIVHYKDDMKLNIKNFLRSFYFRALDHEGMEETLSVVTAVLRELSNFK